jgi:hypothetical protein
MYGSTFTAPVNCTANEIWFYISIQAQSATFRAAIYQGNTFIASTAETNGNGTQWWDLGFSSPPTLTGGVAYTLVVWADEDSADDVVNLYYDTGSTNQGVEQQVDYGSWPTTASFSHTTHKFSIYCTYTASGAASWKAVENWTGTITAASASWKAKDNWTGTITAASASWKAVDNWTTGTVTAPTLLPPVLVSPGNNSDVDNNKPTFVWTGTADADNYRLEVDNDNNWTNGVVDNQVIGGYQPSSSLIISDNGENKMTDNANMTLTKSLTSTVSGTQRRGN